MTVKIEHDVKTCLHTMKAVNDALEVLNGKWKLQILFSLSTGNKRFKEISREVNGITDRMLSKELRGLEQNLLVTRKVFDTFPPTVEYAMTEHGESLRSVIEALAVWGASHRKKVMEY